MVRLLSFSSSLGAVTGVWREADLLELRMAPGASALRDNPFTQHLTATTLPEGGLTVEKHDNHPALSLPSHATSPPLTVKGCFLEGFEGAQGMGSWVIESADAAAYTVLLDADVVHSGGHSLRLSGGSSMNFDGLSSKLPSPINKSTSVGRK